VITVRRIVRGFAPFRVKMILGNDTESVSFGPLTSVRAKYRPYRDSAGSESDHRTKTERVGKSQPDISTTRKRPKRLVAADPNVQVYYHVLVGSHDMKMVGRVVGHPGLVERRLDEVGGHI